MHSAHETIGVSAGLAALQACDLSGFAVTADAPRRLRVCLVSGSPAHDLDESLEALEAYLTKHGDVYCSRALGEARHGLQGRQNLARAGCLVLFARGIEIVGAQTSGHGLPDRLEMAPAVCRGRRTGRGANGTAEIKIVETARDHPILRRRTVRFSRQPRRTSPSGGRRHGTAGRHMFRTHGSGRLDATTGRQSRLLHVAGPSRRLPPRELSSPAGQRGSLDLSYAPLTALLPRRGVMRWNCVNGFWCAAPNPAAAGTRSGRKLFRPFRRLKGCWDPRLTPRRGGPHPLPQHEGHAVVGYYGAISSTSP